MGITTKKEKDLFWNYYLTLVKELETVSDFIEFDEANYQTYSVELAKILMAASSEVDVVMKQICNSLNKRKKHKNIDDYKKTIKANTIKDFFINEAVVLPRHGLELHPWDNWKGANNPDWWGAYNKIKHERNEHFSKATLKNTLNAMAALFVSIIYLRAIERMPLHNDDDYDSSVPAAWGALTPRERFLKLNRVAIPIIPIE